MTLIAQSTAASDAPLQTDLLVNSVHRLQGYDRVITGAILGGSTAVGDTKVALFVSDVQVAELLNIANDSPLTGYTMFPVDAFVPAGAELRAIVTDAPATNAINLYIEIDESPAAGGDGMGELMGMIP